MNITKSLYISLVFGHSFKDSEGINAYQYNIAITWPKYKYIGGVIQVSQLVLWEKYISDYWIKVNWKPTGFGGRLTVFGNTALMPTFVLHGVHLMYAWQICTFHVWTLPKSLPLQCTPNGYTFVWLWMILSPAVQYACTTYHWRCYCHHDYINDTQMFNPFVNDKFCSPKFTRKGKQLTI